LIAGKEIVFVQPPGFGTVRNIRHAYLLFLWQKGLFSTFLVPQLVLLGLYR